MDFIAKFLADNPQAFFFGLFLAFVFLVVVGLSYVKQGTRLLIDQTAEQVLFRIPHLAMFLIAQAIFITVLTPAMLVFLPSLAGSVVFKIAAIPKLADISLKACAFSLPLILLSIFLSLFFNVVLAECFMENIVGGSGTLWVSLGKTVRRTGGLIVLTGIIAGPMLGLLALGLVINSVLDSKQTVPTKFLQYLVGIVVFAAEDGIWLIASFISILMVRENLGPIDAIKRTYELRNSVQDRAFRKFLLSSSFTGQMIAIPVGVWGVSFICLLVAAVEFGERKTGTMNYDFDVMDYRPWLNHLPGLIAMTFGLGIMTAVACFVFLQMIQTAYIAGLVLYQTDPNSMLPAEKQFYESL